MRNELVGWKITFLVKSAVASVGPAFEGSGKVIAWQGCREHIFPPAR
jgi:hypothetical protein